MALSDVSSVYSLMLRPIHRGFLLSQHPFCLSPAQCQMYSHYCNWFLCPWTLGTPREAPQSTMYLCMSLPSLRPTICLISWYIQALLLPVYQPRALSVWLPSETSLPAPCTFLTQHPLSSIKLPLRILPLSSKSPHLHVSMAAPCS